MLSLDGTPARDVIAGTAEVWVRCITRGKSWSEAHDAPRFEDAFDVLCSTCRRWPAPADFLQALPARPAERREPVRRMESAASRERVQSIIASIAQHFSAKAPDPAPSVATDTADAAATEATVEGQAVTRNSD